MGVHFLYSFDSISISAWEIMKALNAYEINYMKQKKKKYLEQQGPSFTSEVSWETMRCIQEKEEFLGIFYWGAAFFFSTRPKGLGPMRSPHTWKKKPAAMEKVAYRV